MCLPTAACFETIFRFVSGLEEGYHGIRGNSLKSKKMTKVYTFSRGGKIYAFWILTTIATYHVCTAVLNLVLVY